MFDLDAQREDDYLDRERNENNRNQREITYDQMMERLHLPPFEGVRSKYDLHHIPNCFAEHLFQI